MSDFTTADYIAKALELKAYVEAEDDAHKERMKLYKEAIAAIEATCGVLLQQQGAQNIHVDGIGTAYLQHGDSITIENEAEYVKFVLDGHLEFLDARVLKAPVRKWVDEHGAEPPGVCVNPFVKCIIRK